MPRWAAIGPSLQSGGGGGAGALRVREEEGEREKKSFVEIAASERED